MRLSFYIIFLFISLPLLLSGQEEKEDRIQSMIERATTEQANGSSAGKILSQWLQVYELIKKETHHPQLAQTCQAIADIYQAEELHEQALPYYLQAVQALEQGAVAKEVSFPLFQEMAWAYAQLSNTDSATYFYQLILNEKEQAGNLNGQINTLQKMAQAYTLNEQHQKALERNLQIKQLLESNEFPDRDLIKIYNNLGYNYTQLKNDSESIAYFSSALDLIEANDLNSKIILNTNIGIAHYNLGQFNESISYLSQVRKDTKKYKPKELDEIDQLLATVYLKKNDLYNALTYSEQSEERAVKNRNHILLTDIYYTTALLHSELYEYDLALDYFQKHLRLRDSFELEEKLRQQQLLQQQINLAQTEKEIKLFYINEDIKELTIAQLKAEAENQQLAFKNKEVELLAEQKEKEILRQENELKASKLKAQASETERAKQQLELARQRLKVSQQEKEVASLQQKEELQQLEIKNKEAQLTAEQNEKNLLLRDKEINDLELQKQKERTQFLYSLRGLMAAILLIIAAGLLYSRRLNRQLNNKNKAIEQQKEEINQEKKKADDLLLNILPEEIAKGLKSTGKTSTKTYESASILFTDFKDFTVLVAQIPAQVLVKELNEIFSYFDDVMEELEIEKIGTIGDAYLAACGLPKENADHAAKCIKAARKMLLFLEERNKHSAIQWRMRVGIHSGPVIAGVVGKKKFAYDLFGDTVNTASRIESNGEAGRINISQSTYDLVKNDPDFSFENRGEIYAKGKGKMEMWFVS